MLKSLLVQTCFFFPQFLFLFLNWIWFWMKLSNFKKNQKYIIKYSKLYIVFQVFWYDSCVRNKPKIVKFCKAQYPITLCLVIKSQYNIWVRSAGHWSSCCIISKSWTGLQFSLMQAAHSGWDAGAKSESEQVLSVGDADQSLTPRLLV